MRHAFRHALPALLLVSSLAGASAAQGTLPIEYTWDAQAFLPGIQGGDGDWHVFGGIDIPGPFDKHWIRFDPNTGLTTVAAWLGSSNGEDTRAIFGTSPGTVSLSKAVDAERLRFDVGGYVVAGPQSIRTTEVEVAAGTATLSAPLTSVPSLVKTGAGDLAIATSPSLGALDVEAGRVVAAAGSNVFLSLTSTFPDFALTLRTGAEMGLPFVTQGSSWQRVQVVGAGTARMTAPTVYMSTTEIRVADGSTLDVTSALQGSGIELALFGPGDVRLHDAGGCSGAISVAGGRLIVDAASGSPTGTAILVLSGTLCGTGHVDGTVGGAGRIDPGTPESPIGTLTLGGLIVQNEARIVCDVGPSSADRVVVTGTAGIGPMVLEMHDQGGLVPGRAIEVMDLTATTGTIAGPITVDSPVPGAAAVLGRRIFFLPGVPADDCDGDLFPDAAELSSAPGLSAIGFGSLVHASGAGLFDTAPSGITAEGWIRAETVAGAHAVVSKGAVAKTFELRVADGRLSFRFDIEGVIKKPTREFASLAAVVQPAIWQHVAVSYPFGGVPTLYVNGVAVAGAWIGASDGTPALSTADVNVGAVSDDAWPSYSVLDPFAGWIADVRLWSVARSAAEIASSAATALAGNEPGLAAAWEFEEGAGNSFADTKGLHDAVAIDASGVLWAKLAKDVNGNGQLDLCEHATAAPVGVGCGILGSPVLAATPPVMGGTLTATGSGFSPNAFFAFAIGAGPPTALPLGVGCTLYIDVSAVLSSTNVVTDANGIAALSLGIPNVPAWVGADLTAQALTLVPGAPALGWLELSNGVAMKLGY
ncbi:MAG TPA: LamG-like jellyroll fold domain-containing protein [Planctomycetota bacterium]|nr:LamG-like jellyroll fold domain-containing protein [Planctomycetota bacterium]